MTQPYPVALNDVNDVIRLLKSNTLYDLLRAGDPAGCNCMGTFHCTGHQEANEDIEALPLSEHAFLKKERIRELQRQIEDAERQITEAAEPAKQGPESTKQGYGPEQQG